MAITLVIVLLVVATLAFHFVSPWWFTPLASNWQAIDDTINISLWVTGVVFVLVNLFLAYAIYKFRFDNNRRAEYQPENKKLENWLTLLTAIGVAAMLIPGLFVWAEIISPPANSRTVEVVGQQWHWTYRFPGEDGRLGKTALELVDESNPFGLDPTDPYSQDDRLIQSNELHLPIDQPIKLILRSKDVLHNFAVPQFRVKMDLVPGIASYVWFTPNRVGRYDILCEELCGVAHFTMRGRVIVESEADFIDWLHTYPTYSQLATAPVPDLAVGKGYYSGCIACHGASGEGNTSMNAPSLAGIGAWYLERQLQYFKDKVRGGPDADEFAQQMAAMAILLPDHNAIRAVSHYISRLPAAKLESPATTKGDPIKGRILYTNCAHCHGANAQGNYATNAPRLSSQYPWYLKRQLQSYRDGRRGGHLRDAYGSQMQLMSRVLQDDKSIDDVVQYISSLHDVNSRVGKLAKMAGAAND